MLSGCRGARRCVMQPPDDLAIVSGRKPKVSPTRRSLERQRCGPCGRRACVSSKLRRGPQVHSVPSRSPERSLEIRLRRWRLRGRGRGRCARVARCRYVPMAVAVGKRAAITNSRAPTTSPRQPPARPKRRRAASSERSAERADALCTCGRPPPSLVPHGRPPTRHTAPTLERALPLRKPFGFRFGEALLGLLG